MGNFSSSPIYLFDKLFIIVWAHGYLFGNLDFNRSYYIIYFVDPIVQTSAMGAI